MKALLKALKSDRSGTSAMEFALVIPVVLSLIAGTFEFAMITFRTSILEGGLREAARFGTTGADVAGITREEAIINIVNDHSAGLFTVTATDLTPLVYPDFDKIGQAEPYTDTDGSGSYDAGEPYDDVNCNSNWDSDMGLSGAGGGGEVVLYTVDLEIDSITGLIDPMITNGAGKIPISASIAIRNEPFPGGTTVCP